MMRRRGASSSATSPAAVGKNPREEENPRREGNPRRENNPSKENHPSEEEPRRSEIYAKYPASKLAFFPIPSVGNLP